MSKTNIIVALSAAVVTFFTMAILGAVLLEDEPETTQDTVKVQDKYEEPNFKDDFVKGCSAEGASEEMCSCMFDKLKADYTLEEMAGFGVNGELPVNYTQRYIKPCQNELNAQQI